MNTGKALLGTLAGIAAGALIGVLFAPGKGSDTRKKISKKSVGYSDSLKEKFNEFIDSLSEKAKEVVKISTNGSDNHGGSDSELDLKTKKTIKQ